MSEESAGGIGIKLTADNSEMIKGLQEAAEKVNSLGEVAEALGLAEIFEKWGEALADVTKIADENAMALMRVQAATSGLQTDKFAELAEQLSEVSVYSKATSLNAMAMLGNFSLNDKQIAEMIPHLQDMATLMGTDLTSAASAFGMAISSGQVSARRLKISLDEQEQAAFKLGTTQERVNMLMAKTAQYNGLAAGQADTATGAHQKFSNQLEELDSALGSLIDKPVAKFYEEAAEKVALITEGFNTLKPEIRDAIGDFAEVVGCLASLALGAAAAWKAVVAFNEFTGITSMVTGGIAAITEAVEGLTMASALAAAPWVAMVGTIAAVGAALVTLEGVMKHNITADSAQGIIEGLKQGFSVGLNDIKGGVKDVFSGLFVGNQLPGSHKASSAEGGEGKDFSASGGHSSGVNPMFADMMKNENESRNFDMGLNFAHFTAGLDDTATAAEKAAQELNQAELGMSLSTDIAMSNKAFNDFMNNMSASADLQAKIQEDLARTKDAQIAKLAASGGSFTSMLAGVNSGKTAA